MPDVVSDIVALYHRRSNVYQRIIDLLPRPELNRIAGLASFNFSHHFVWENVRQTPDSLIFRSVLESELRTEFDNNLSGIAGFWFDDSTVYQRWRLNLPVGKEIIVACRDRREAILALAVIPKPSQPKYYLLTSAMLPQGSKAVAYSLETNV